MALRLIKGDLKYQKQIVEMLDEWTEYNNTYDTNHSPAAIFQNDYHDFENYINNLDYLEPNKGLVPQSTFFCLDDVRNIIVGAVNIRHYLNDFLLQYGGHIGDGIRPSERRKGYATQMINLSLDECRKLGIERVLITCNRDNIGSARSIENNGGIFENEVENDGEVLRRYWIDLTNKYGTGCFPILENDPDKNAVLEPLHENLHLNLPEKCIFAFLSDKIIKDFVVKNNGREAGVFETVFKNSPVYIFDNYNNKDAICLIQSPTGSACASDCLDWLIAYGVKKILAVGSCGVLDNIAAGEFLVVEQALRDEGTSYHYMPPARWARPSKQLSDQVYELLLKKGLKCDKVKSWTTDGFFRETKGKIVARKKEGCKVVEMESSALMSVAAFRKASFAQILFTADSLADVDNYDDRNFGRDVQPAAMQISFEIMKEIDLPR